MGPVGRDVGRVDDQQDVVVGDAVHEQVVDRAAALVAEHRVLGGAIGQLRHVVGDEPLGEVERLRAADPELTHVAHVEQARRLAHGAVLIEDARVLDGHVPPAEGGHLGAEGEVPGVKGGDLERSVGHRGAEASGKVPRQGGGEGADGWLFSR